MNEFISAPAGVYKENTMYSQHVTLVFLISKQTGTHCHHKFTSCIILHNKVQYPFIQISHASLSLGILTGLSL